MKERTRNGRTPRTRRPRLLAGAVTFALGASLAACGGSESPPVARLAVAPTRLELPYGGFADLRFAWTPLSAPEGLEESARVFVHLLDSEGDLVRTFDHDATWRWRVGQELSYEARVYQSLLAPPLPAGTYEVTVGLYDRTDGGRWGLETEGEQVGRSEYRVATVVVPRPDAERLPVVRFTSSWSPTTAGGDRQVIAFRWLSGQGAMVLEDLPGPGTVWLSLGIPGEVVGEMRRRLVDPPTGGAGVPRVDIEATCSGFESQVSGEGTHTVEVPVEPSADACEITLEPNFVLESPTGDQRSVLLEVLAWQPS